MKLWNCKNRSNNTQRLNMSIMSDLDEFNSRVSGGDDRDRVVERSIPGPEEIVSTTRNREKGILVDAKMWAVYGDRYSPCEHVERVLPPGQYTVENSQDIGIHFHQVTSNMDDLLELPDSASQEVITEVTSFWQKEQHFRDFGFLWKRGMMLWGPPGSGKCLKKDTPVLMYDGTVKMVQDVVVGDMLMGDDSLPRRVLSLATGREQMYEIQQMNGDNYVVNESHILSLVRSTWKKGRYNPHRHSTDYRDISVLDYINSSPNFKKEWFGYKVGVEFDEQPVPLDPYFLGLWIGDGTSTSTDITTMDTEIVNYLYDYSRKMNVRFVDRQSTTSGKASTFALVGESFVEGSNPIRTGLKELNLINNKHIPACYKINSRRNRLKLLAGLIDSDGYLGTNCFEFSNTNDQVIDDVVFLVRSLGFKVSVSSKKSYNKRTGFVGSSKSVHISGHTDTIPTRVARKQATVRKQKKNPLHTSINVVPVGEDDYYGFEIDGNRRFILGDFTVTHNTVTVQLISQFVIKNNGIALFVNDPHLCTKGLRLLRAVEPNRHIVMILEDVDSIIDNYGETALLALMDGELQIDNVLFIATTNYPERLDKRFINRPSRFDVIKKIGMPSPSARRLYLATKNGRLKDTNELEQWVDATEGFSVAHLKELIVAVEVFGVSFDHAASRLKKMMDVKVSSTQCDDSRFGFMSS